VAIKRGPGAGYETVRKFAKGTTFESVGSDGHWLKMRLSEHENHLGYIDQQFAVLRTKEHATESRSAIPGSYIIAASVNARSGPGNNYAVVSKMPKNTKIVVIGMEGNWLRIASNRGDLPVYIERKYALFQVSD
jgi:uncharacterized protein YgiM (DUF1202 family)